MGSAAAPRFGRRYFKSNQFGHARRRCRELKLKIGPPGKLRLRVFRMHSCWASRLVGFAAYRDAPVGLRSCASSLKQKHLVSRTIEHWYLEFMANNIKTVVLLTGMT